MEAHELTAVAVREHAKAGLLAALLARLLCGTRPSPRSSKQSLVRLAPEMKAV